MGKEPCGEPILHDVRIEKQNPWFELVTRTVLLPHRDSPEEFYSIRPRDYVNALVLDETDSVVLVRQYRPVVERWLDELPGGQVDAHEDPDTAMRRELDEELGGTLEELSPLATLLTDHGRMENRLHAYFARCRGPFAIGHAAEGVEVVRRARETFLDDVREGRFPNGLQLGIVALACLRGLLDGASG